MHLNSLSISGWRSFAPQSPFELENLGRLNILLGPNGVGKSNLGRFFEWLAQSLQGHHLQQVRSVERERDMLLRFEEVDSWQRDGGPMQAKIGIKIDSLPPRLREWAQIQYAPAETFELRLTAYRQGNSDRWRASLMPYSNDGEAFFRPQERGQTEVRIAPGHYAAAAPDQHGPHWLAAAIGEELPQRWLRIPALRDPDAPSSVARQVHEALAKLSQANANGKQWALTRRRLGEWMTRLTGERVTIDAPGEGVRMTSEGLELPSLLRDAGDGVAQLLYLLARLCLWPSEPCVVFLDEPEAHLHPGAAADLLSILETDFPWVQAIIATHSPSVVDTVSPDWGMWSLSRGQDGATTAIRVNTQPERIATLDALGVSPSQIFLARVVVWVEGPSDAMYYRRLLREVAPDLMFRRDFAFAIYGGRAGSHLSIEDDEDAVIDVLCLAHRNILTYDAGVDDTTPPAFVKRWDQARAESKLPGSVLPTPGREVENLVLPEVLLGVIASRIKTIRSATVETSIRFSERIEIPPHQRFSEALADAASSSDGAQLMEAQRQSVRKQIDSKKTTFARQIVADAAPTVFTAAAREWGVELAKRIREHGDPRAAGRAK